jgi:hypothetical protein
MFFVYYFCRNSDGGAAMLLFYEFAQNCIILYFPVVKIRENILKH